jgi:hypothetical protein
MNFRKWICGRLHEDSWLYGVFDCSRYEPGEMAGDEPKYSVVVFFFAGFSNLGVTLQRYRECLVDGRLDRWNSSTDPECWTDNNGVGSIVTRSETVYDTLSAYSAKLQGEDVSIYQDILLRPSCSAMIRLKYKCVGATTPKIRFYDTGSNQWLKSDGDWQASETAITLSNSTAWTEYSITFTAHADYSAYRLFLFCDTGGDNAYFDYVEVKRFYEPAFFAPYIGDRSMPSIRHSVGNYHEPEEQLSFGVVKFIDDGWFAGKYDTYLWHNKLFYVKLGQADSTYDELISVFTGLSRQPSLVSGSFSVEIKDSRSEFGRALQQTFNSTDYPNCHDDWKNRPIPILIGQVENITPPYCNTATYTFKVSQTAFGSTTYPLQAISAVYKDGVLQTLTTHYTVDLTAGTFTITSDPGDTEITCDAKGIKMDWMTGAYDYSYLPHALFKFLYVDLGGTSKELINWASLLSLYATRKLICCAWISEDMEIRELLRLLRISSICQTYTLPNGEIYFRALLSAIPGDTQRFGNEDFLTPPEFTQDTDQCYKKIVGRGRQDPTSGEWHKEATTTANTALWQHGVKREFEVDTILYTEFQLAYDLVPNYSDMLKIPLFTLKVKLPAQALLLNPTDKIYVSYSFLDADGEEITVCTNQVFIVFDIEKNINDATATVLAVKDYDKLYWTLGLEDYYIHSYDGSYDVAGESLTLTKA